MTAATYDLLALIACGSVAYGVFTFLVVDLASRRPLENPLEDRSGCPGPRGSAARGGVR